MKNVDHETTSYFADLWHQQKPKWQLGEVPAAKMEEGMPVPIDYILTTIARVVDQEEAPVPGLIDIGNSLKAVAQGQFIYPFNSLHISLLGCTPRYASLEEFTGDRIRKVSEACHKALSGRGAIQFELRGVGIVGNQVFVQVFPHNYAWAEIRRDMEVELQKIGETPISYSNKLPVHMNILRVTDNRPERLDELLAVIDELHTREVGRLVVSNVALMTTDFIVSPRNTNILHTFTLQDS
jgi:hypothetical protein